MSRRQRLGFVVIAFAIFMLIDLTLPSRYANASYALAFIAGIGTFLAVPE